jgi:transcriptional regulator with XRE-family HTH domain
MASTKADFDRALGGSIRAARDRAGVKQEQLALAVGLSRTSITNIERGRQGVQAYLLVRIAEVLGRPAGELLPGLDPGDPIADKVKELEPSKRAWAERVMRSTPEDDDHAT